jgi:hypothetical protein
MRWNEALALAARQMSTGDIRRLLADPEVTPNGRRILQEEMGARAAVPQQRRAEDGETPQLRAGAGGGRTRR